VIREHLFHKRAPADPLFRWRGGVVAERIHASLVAEQITATPH
jgi:hypothetical protein